AVDENVATELAPVLLDDLDESFGRQLLDLPGGIVVDDRVFQRRTGVLQFRVDAEFGVEVGPSCQCTHALLPSSAVTKASTFEAAGCGLSRRRRLPGRLPPLR